ncbi:MAG TPA: VWA domain-containing protein [bacterium]|nr:VWA domain-containing protein [bacterium]
MEEMQIRFQGLPLWIIIPMALACVYTIWKYNKFLVAIDFKRPAFPLVLRSITLALLVLLACGPVVYRSERAPVPKKTAFVFDGSQSMRIAESGKRSRWELVLEAARSIAGRLDSEPLVYIVSEDVLPVGSISEAERMSPLGAESFLSGGTARVRNAGDEPFTDIIVFSDGRDTSGIIAGAGSGVKVHTVGVGKAGNMKNIGVEKISVPEYGFAGSPLEIKGYVHESGLEKGEKIGVELFEAGVRKSQDMLEAEGEVAIQQIYINYIPDSQGLKDITIKVKVEGEEEINDDNAVTVFTDVISEKRAVLYIDSPRWEYTFLNRFLGRKQKLNADILLMSPGKAFKGRDIRKHLAAAEGLDGYRAVIVGDVADALTAGEKSNILEYVKAGGNIVILGGRRSLFGETGEWKQLVGKKLFPAIGGSEEGFEVALTEAGMDSDLFRFSNSREENRRIWKSLPFIQTFNRFVPGSGMDVYAEHPWLKCGERECPLMVEGAVGNGRFFAIAFEGLWRWGFSVRGEDVAAYEKFLGNLMESLMENERQKVVSVIVSNRTPMLGEKVGITVRLDPALTNGDVVPGLVLTGPDGEEIKTVIEAVEGRPGYFAAEVTPEMPGMYGVMAEAAGKSSEKQPFAASVSGSEFRQVSGDDEYLRQAAEKSGGIFVDVNSIDRLVDGLRENKEFVKVRVKQTPWPMPLLMIFIVCLLTAEWIVRRRGGLA